MWKCSQCGRQNAGHATRCIHCGFEMPAAATATSLTGELLRLLAEGRKLEAVKLYKDRTGARLLDAKIAVEALQRGEGLPQSDDHSPADDAYLATEVAALLRAGNKLQAVKLYKERTGVSLMDAKKAVEAMAGGAASAPIDDSLVREILPFLRMGEVREAVRAYQRRTGAPPRDAKRAVRALAKQHGAYDRESAWLRGAVMLFFLLVGALAVVGALALLAR